MRYIMKKIFKIISFILLAIALVSCKTTPDSDSTPLGEDESMISRMAELEKLISDLKQDISDKDDELDALTSEINLLKENNTALSSALEQGNDDKSNQLSQLNSEILDLNSQLKQITAERNNLKKDINVIESRMKEAANSIKEDFSKEIEDGVLEIYRSEGVLIINLSSSILFRPDSSILQDEYKGLLKKMAEIFKRFPDKIIRVEGHTASAKVSKYSSSWILGAERSVNVVQYFQDECKVDPTRLLAVSFGEYRPITENSDEKSKMINRRVQIVLLDRPIYKIDELIKVK